MTPFELAWFQVPLAASYEALLSQFSLPPGHHWEPFDLNEVETDDPLWASLVSSAYEALPHIWLSQEPSDLSVLNSDSPPWSYAVSPLRAFLGQFTYIVHCAFIVYFASQLDTILFPNSLKTLFKCLFWLISDS
jgi:hypothetical protein